MGSGKVIRSSIEKYGIENFKKDILETFQDAKSMYAREKELVTEEFLEREDVYNLRRGGTGGFDYINKNKLNGFSDNNVAKKGRVSADKKLKEKYGKNWRKVLSELGHNAIKKKYQDNHEYLKVRIECMKYARKYAFSEESNLKRQKTLKKIFSGNKHQSGNKNSNYGKHWITDGINNKSVYKNDIIPDGYRKGRVMKK